MVNELTQGGTVTALRQLQKSASSFYYLCISFYKQIMLLALTISLLLASLFISRSQINVPSVYANPGMDNTCAWYRIHIGDTLSGIAANNRISVRRLASVNMIRNINLIFAGQALCIPHILKTAFHEVSVQASSGMMSGGYIRWYAYTALQWSSQAQVATLLRQAAWRYGIPANLLLAISWQESGWNQHIIAHDGGIGAMQIMPYTAMVINQINRARFDPYQLQDNINLGACYLHTLWLNFHGDLTKVISAYNEGGWNVVHRGIFNWRYVHNVYALMRKFR